MGKKRILYFLLGAYLLGNVLLIFIQYNWAKNLNTLIRGNEKLVNEFTVSGQLKELERDILSVESRIRGTVNTKDTSFINGLELQIIAVEASLDRLKTDADNDSSIQYISILDHLVHDKIVYSRNILNAYYGVGKSAAETVIASRRGKELTDSIMTMAREIELARQQHLAKVSASLDTSGTNALHLGIILISSVLVCGAFVFWYVINTIRRQNELIHQLNLSEKKEREAARIKENFLANMSHEIRTPMNAILGYTNLLQRKKTMDADARQYVQTIQRSGENLLAIINDILDLSKIEAGMMRIEAAPFSLRELMHSVEVMFRPKATSKGLGLHTELADSLPELLEGDAVRLTQILVNLLGNAVKFTSEGSITVRVRGGKPEENRIEVHFAVADTGIGIEKANLATIFERFQQAESSVTRNYGGTGLGLSIARDLVKLQGGEMDVESEAGKGTVFHFYIPYQIASMPEAVLPQQEEALLSTPQLQNKSVLVAEDNEINQGLLTILLQQWGVQSRVVRNGAEAIEALQAAHFDLVLMDIQMPEMDGYTAARKIRSELHLKTPIIAMTAHAMAGEREKCLGYGMNDYIPKPVRERQLYTVLLQFLAPDGTGQRGAKPQPAVGHTAYRFIDLGYMREVSAGNIAYEKLVTEQFLEMLPVELKALREAWEKGDRHLAGQVAHNMKTTVSIMGLDALFQPHLDEVEAGNLTSEQFEKHYRTLQTLGENSLQEASDFHRTLL